MWRQGPGIPATTLEAKTGGLQVQGLPGLVGEFLEIKTTNKHTRLAM